ncbi:fatty acid-binding protein-like [Schistocerca americana]|uniref:fatty acid-binding protein-like n=1 Tax=Schistocerca americana TaxID=7009 RepID=UPI001F4FDC02|nr:fatty acid-binding protein-like [Schistocerca americana]XP_047098788.1 fatty acid-binding protein-like [Schistocerca piceifrons]XP_049794057.1 fatty acid-binding protein-like [Schistocerca nitens]XP_049942931.1 fatty acid-binding protein-like [Schistocerca serialis cubense]
MPLEQCLGRKYKLEKTENFDEFLKAFGASYLVRKMVQVATPVVELSRDGETYTFTSVSPFKTSVLKFKLGEEFSEERHDGVQVKSVIQLQDDSTLFHLQRGDRDTTITRRFTPERVTITMQVDDIICTKVYKSV